MTCCSVCRRNARRLLTVFPDWFGGDEVQGSILLVGLIACCLGAALQLFSTGKLIEIGTRTSHVLNFASLVFISIGTSIVAAGILFRVTQKKDDFQGSLERAGVLFVGDRDAFNEAVGWDNWILETRRCSELIIIGKDQVKWAEDSAAALGSVLAKNIDVTFIFQGEKCDERLAHFWEKLIQQDFSGKFVEWRERGKLKLCRNNDPKVNYGYYWNGEKLIVKLYFDVAEKREAPFIVFNVSFASGKFDDSDFSVTCLQHVPFSEKKKMLVQAGMNMTRIIRPSQPVPI